MNPEHCRKPLLAVTAWAVTTHAALATEIDPGADLPWNEPLETIGANITGPTASVLIIIAVVVGLIIWAISDDNRAVARTGKAIAALAIVAALFDFFGDIGIDGATL